MSNLGRTGGEMSVMIEGSQQARFRAILENVLAPITAIDN
jgi:hypothetical protein